MTTSSTDQLRTRAREWLDATCRRREEVPDAFDVSVFHDLPDEEERGLLDALCAWHQQAWDAGVTGLEWSEEYGGHGLDREAQDVVDAVVAEYAVPPAHELFSVTTHLVAPTVALFGTPAQRAEFVGPFARAERLCVQLFSEPGAGSDLAGLATRARREGDGWVIDGQKVWSSGAQFADHGLLIARTDETAIKHAGLTAFLVPMGGEGMTVRPLRQMSGGTSFCEVFLDGLVVPDGCRLGEVGEGWKVATTTLSFERDTSGSDTETGGGWHDVLRLARETGRVDDPLIRQGLADVLIHHRLTGVAAARDLADREAGRPQGPEGSMRKLQWVTGMMRISNVVAEVLASDLVADTGRPRTFDWTAHVLGAPGYRIAGGTDEIQRTIIAERILGLPSGPRVDRGRPWKDIPR